ncbi:Uncharacterized protein T26G10.4-like Protein [Tribolium castaneum]|uniref:Uncharacterized protein T26G10.4-like Protein n=1 Tax=Tribolium castaneum TaxID=7070 RepID=D6WBH7_TRICA|nr:PREDICTED: uncharacterized protein T26G10.4-like [Tribolium castaneum]EEZ99158.1 Uncharacterized protein T26G10.4-like Protein [Tribolium castaneum]|eukprot:XP_015836992.1 PREDICTED: uncharacterized protein T26G10.4-like [Tribolium castaneum]
MLNAISTVANDMQVRFNASKCAILDLDCTKRNTRHMTKLKIQNEEICPLHEGEAYQHLGIPTGYHVDTTPEATIERMTKEVENIDQSLLAPWQKIDAVNTFVSPKLGFLLRGTTIQKKKTNRLDSRIKAYAKKWLFLPERASPELVYLPCSKGGAGLLPVADSIIQAVRMLTATDTQVNAIAVTQMEATIKRRIGRTPSNEDSCEYLVGGRVRSGWGRHSLTVDAGKKRNQKAAQQSEHIVDPS